jgi:hypothetical protein
MWRGGRCDRSGRRICCPQTRCDFARYFDAQTRRLMAVRLIREKVPNAAIIILTLYESIEMARIAAYAGGYGLYYEVSSNERFGASHRKPPG